MREKADITKVDKRGAIYTVHGTYKGRRASFHVTAPSLESMSHKDAQDFMKRNIHSIISNKDE